MDGLRMLNRTEKEIRLLKVRAGHDEEPVYAEILYTSLLGRSKLPYETVSYVWGKQSDRGTIYIEGNSTDVPYSCERALRRMRLQFEDRILWIDAVCINQGDVLERNSQVAIMNDIYRSTWRNLIWLGEHDSQPANALEQIFKVLEDARAETNDFRDLMQTVKDADTGVVQWAKHGLSTAVDWESLRSFFSCTWFRRLWVFQEGVLAPQSLCYYGELDVDYLDVIRAAYWLAYKQLHLPFRFGDEVGLQNAAKMWIFVNPEESIGKQDDWRGHLLNVLSNLSSADASDNRDHVYGLLGLYQKFRPSQELPQLLLPNYQNSLADVLRDATRHTIIEEQQLTCFGHLSQRYIQSAIAPSWVPLWYERWDRFQDPTGLRDKFSACGRYDRYLIADEPTAPQDLNTLSTEGIRLDSVAQVLWSVRRGISPSDYIQNLDNLHRALEKIGYTNSHHRDEMIAYTLVQGLDIRKNPLSAKAALERFRAWSGYIKTHDAIPPSFRTKISDEEILQAAEYDSAFVSACLLKSLFLTANGHLGIGAQTMLAGDIVAILWGCKWPVILRPAAQQGRYSVVGVMWMDGIMYGEAVANLKEKGHLSERFLLQ